MHPSTQQAVTNGHRRSGRLHIATHRSGPAARVRVSGELAETGHRHLAALLDMMVMAGCERITIHLAGVDVVDSSLLQLLRAARTRLGGGLTVVAERAEARFRLGLVGFDGCVWSGGDVPSVGAELVRRQPMR